LQLLGIVHPIQTSHMASQEILQNPYV
jgi:hypothetical protein